MKVQSSTGGLPDFVIIGAMKCGTTSLHYYLDGHPDVTMSATKELNFFSDDLYWSQGIDWYRSQFNGDGRIRGEASPIYTDYPFTPHVPERMHSLIPNVKLIYVVRDPIQRMISHYVHAISSGEECRDFQEAVLGDSDNPYLGRSRYFTQIERYLARFRAEQLLVITQEELLRERAGTLRKVFQFLGVDAEFRSSRFENVRHKSSDKRMKTPLGQAVARFPLQEVICRLPSALQWHAERLIYLPFSDSIPRPELDEPTRSRLVELLEGEMRDFRRLTGLPLLDWSV